MVGLRPIIEFMTWNFSRRRVRSDPEQRGEDPADVGRAVQRARSCSARPNGSARAGRLRSTRTRWSTSTRTIPGLKVVAPAIAGRREGPAEDGHPRRQPGPLHGERDALQREGRGPRRRRAPGPDGRGAASRARARTSRSSRGRGWCTSRSRRPRRSRRRASRSRSSTCARSARSTRTRSSTSVAQDPPRRRRRTRAGPTAASAPRSPTASSGSRSTSSTRRSCACTTLDVPMPYNAKLEQLVHPAGGARSSRR